MENSPEQTGTPERLGAPDFPLPFSSSDFKVDLLPLEKIALYLATALFVVITLVLASSASFPPNGAILP